MTTSVRTPLARWVVGVALAAAASGALADPQSKRSLEPAVTLRFGDLNTSTAKGSRILYDRIGAAAMAVCSQGGAWYPSQHWAREDCYQATVDRVVAKLDLPVLTALHLAKTQRGPAMPALQTRND